MPPPPLINAEPVVHARRVLRRERARPLEEDDETREPFDALEVFGHLREICDPEHPHTLEQARRRTLRARRGPRARADACPRCALRS